MKITVDRIEGDIAVCELSAGNFVNVPVALFPDAKEGDVFNIEKDTASSESQKNYAQSLFDKLKKK